MVANFGVTFYKQVTNFFKTFLCLKMNENKQITVSKQTIVDIQNSDVNLSKIEIKLKEDLTKKEKKKTT